MLQPFLKALAAVQNKELKDRVTDNVFKPILENNKTIPEPASDEEEQMKK